MLTLSNLLITEKWKKALTLLFLQFLHISKFDHISIYSRHETKIGKTKHDNTVIKKNHRINNHYASLVIYSGLYSLHKDQIQV